MDAEKIIMGLFMISLISPSIVSAITDLDVWEKDSMTKVGPDDPAEEFDGKITVSAAKNEKESFQVVLNAKTDMDVNIYVSDLSDGNDMISKDYISLFRVGYVSTIDRDSDYNEVDYGMLPDPLIPINTQVSLDAHKNQPVWIKIKVPKSARSGHYTGTITISADGEEYAIPLELVVYDFVLPDRPSLQSQFGVTSSSSESFGKFYNKGNYDDKLELLKRFYDKFAEHRINPTNVAYFYLYDFWDAFTFDCQADKLTDVDFSLMDPIFEYCIDDLGFDLVRYPITNTVPVRWDRQNGVGCKDYSWNNYQISDDFKKVQKEYIEIVSRHFEQKGWLDNTLVYLTDEPCEYTQRFAFPESHPSYEVVKDYYMHIKDSDPRLRWIQTENIEPSLYDYTDVWIPGFKSYSEYDADERRAYGQEVWWYNVGSRIETPGIQTRAIIWDSYSRNVDGILDWGINYWTYNTVNEDPWQGTRRGGDGYLLYPGTAVGVDDDLVSSIRLENLGDGIEDYEYLKLIENKYGKDFARGIAENIAKGSYFAKNRFETVDPDELNDLRERIADMIMKDNNNQVFYDSFISTDNLDSMTNVRKSYDQEGKLTLEYVDDNMKIDDFEAGTFWHPSNNQPYTDSLFSVSDEYAAEGEKSGKFSFRRTGPSNSGGCYDNNWNIRIYMNTIPSGWSQYDLLEFDIMPAEMSFQDIILHTNFGFSERIGYYSMNGTLPGKWHHVKIDLSGYDLSSVTTLGFIMHTNSMEITDKFYDFYIDNMQLRKKEYKRDGEIISKPIHLSGVTRFNGIEWASDFHVPDGSGLKIYTATSGDGVIWSSWAEITKTSEFSGTINSPTDDWIRYKIEFTSDGKNTPAISEIRINYNGADPCSGKSDGESCYQNGYICCNDNCVFGDCCSQDDCYENQVCGSQNFCTDVVVRPCTDADTNSDKRISNSEFYNFIINWMFRYQSVEYFLNVLDKWKNGCE